MRRSMSVRGLIAIIAMSAALIFAAPGASPDRLGAAGSPPPPGSEVGPGFDLFTTPPGGTTFVDFPPSNPIPPDFFGPNSDPFIGRINFQGQPLDTNSPIPFLPDTIVRRNETAMLPNPGSSDTVPIEIVALSLVSSNPITVTFNGGQTPQLWDVRVCLSSNTPQQPGNMTITRSPCKTIEGGTFTATLPVTPKFIFTNQQGSRPQIQFLDHAQTIQFDTLNGHWSTFDPGFRPVPPLGGLQVDHDCDPMTSLIDIPQLASNFFPGIRRLPCIQNSCRVFAPPMKRMTQEIAMLASHGVIPAGGKLLDFDRDGFPDDADNCPRCFNPLQQDADNDGIGDVCDGKPTTYNPCQGPGRCR